MKNNDITDTMALVLRLEKRKMGRKARAIYREAERGKASILIPAMVLVEFGYLSERHKIDTNLTEVGIFCRNYPSVNVTPITEEIIHTSCNYLALPSNLMFYMSFVLIHGSVVVFSPHPTPPAPKNGVGVGVSDDYGNTRNDTNGHIAELLLQVLRSMTSSKYVSTIW